MTERIGRRPIAHDLALELSAAAMDFPLPPDQRARLDAHLEVCAGCRRTAGALDADARALARVVSTGAPSARPLLALIDAASVRPRRRTGRALTLVAAAVLLLAMVTGAMLGGALNTIRRPFGLEPFGVMWTQMAGPATLDALLPGSSLATVAALPLPGAPLIAGGSRAADAALWMSRDERTWQLVDDPDLGRGRIEAIAASGGRIVAVGASVDPDGLPAGRIWESADGRSWDMVAVPAMRSIAAVAVTPSLVVVAGVPRSFRDAPLWLSIDGGAWQAWDPGTMSRATVTGLAVGGPGFVAVGYDDRGGRAWTSSDGRTWTSAEPAGFERGRLVAVAATPAGLVAVGWTTDDAERTTPTAWISSDGSSWTRTHLDASVRDGRLAAVAPSPYGIVAVGGATDGSAAWVSDDGRTWQRLDTAPASDVPTLAAVGIHGEHVIVAGTGHDGPAIWSGRRP
ncbi:MAG TPA: zf-HC2 domain-containing protein [Candidatus Limnocylindrales bacterium]|nr:zf-HC2 domain-containing protein [Candidatus Limnocylindrales bacterium]